MSELAVFLANPIVAMVGYVFGVVSGVIAIHQFLSARNALRELNSVNVKNAALTLENSELRVKISNRNRVEQGDKSQYFQDNSGSVIIDNRG